MKLGLYLLPLLYFYYINTNELVCIYIYTYIINMKYMFFFFWTEEFVAHTPNVNCLALGHKSGRVLVTGGDDKKVNLWAVGKQNCIMVIIIA